MTTRFFEGVRAQRRAIALLFAGLLVLGSLAALQLPASILPEVSFPRITVIAEAGELPSDVVLRQVTIPLEESIRRVPGVVEVRSITSRGSAEINLDCRWNSDMNLTLQGVQAQVEAVRPQLGAGVVLDARLMNPTLFPVLGFSLTSDRESLARLRDFALLTLKPELSRLPGVAEVVVQGGRRLEARVALDPDALQARGLTAAGVAEAIRRSSAFEAVGLLESNARLYLGLADGRPANLGMLDSLPIPLASGPPVTLGRLGRVSLEEAPEFVRYRARSREAVLVSLLRQPSASAITLSDAARRWLAENARRVPPGVEIETFYDQADLVRASIRSVIDSLLVGALLAFVVILLFLRSLRLALAAALVLPGSIALTLLGLRLMHHSLNMMTLGGIAAAVGLVLDDAIVVVEYLTARSADPDAPDRSRAMAEIFPTLFGSSLCTIAILLPFVLLGGVTGAFFRVLSTSMALMLGASLLLCLTLVPLLSPASHPKPARPGPRLRGFPEAVRRATGSGWVGIAGVIACVALAVPLAATSGSGFLPEMDEGTLILDYVSPPGSSLTETDRLLQEVEKQIDAMPEIVSWSRRTGDQLGFFITEPNIGDYTLRLRSGHRRGASEIADDLRARIEASQPALQIEFGQLVEDVIGDLTTNPHPVEVRLFSEDRPLAESKGREVAALLPRVRGVVDVTEGIVVSGPNVTMAPAPLAALLGLNAEDLAHAAAPAVAGIDVGEIVRGARAWPVRVVLPTPRGLSGQAALADVLVPLGSGRRRLGELARLRTNPGETEIARDNLRTMVPVTARLSGRDLGSAMAEIQRTLARELTLPPDARIQYAGLWAEQQSSFRGLAGVLVGATALVALILLVSFRSWGQTLAILLVVAASLVGVFAALRLTGVPLNISSFVGAIMMVGIVSENAYFLVAAYRTSRAAGLPAVEAATQPALRRTRPVLMTTFAGVAALAPLALGFGTGSALLRPLAIAVVGGFVTSAALLLFILPSLVARFGGGID